MKKGKFKIVYAMSKVFMAPRKYRKPDNQAKLELTRKIAHAIIEAMGAKELEDTWIKLRELFLQIEKENSSQES